MSVIVVGCNHHSADLALLERVAVPSDEIAKTLAGLVGLEHVTEAVLLSTCNRVEVYASVSRFHPGVQEIRNWFAERADVHPQDLDDRLYAYFDERAAAHLFAVAAGVDSMVVGERQIALQVKDAMETARHEGSARRVLLRLFRQAVRVGREVRGRTRISEGASSMVDVGLDAAEEALSGLAGRDVLIVGAGKIGGLAADRVADVAATVRTWNRTWDKAVRLADRVGGAPVPDGSLEEAIGAADLVVCTTGASHAIIDRNRVEAGGPRNGRPLVLLDLAMPRNVDPSCDELDGVSVIDIARVREIADRTVTGEVLASARTIVDDEAGAFMSWMRARSVDPTIRSLRQQAEAIRAAEIDRLSGKLSDLDDRQREAVEALTRGIVNTLLHEPTVRLKQLADDGGAEPVVNALRDLFDLDE